MLKRVFHELASCESVLDVGTGHGAVIGKIAKLSGLGRFVGVDACPQALAFARRKHPIVMFQLGDVRELIKTFGPKSFAAVVGFDIVEHLEKDEAIRMIADAERVAREVVWWFVPIGDHPQDFDPFGEGNEKLQQHRSTWRPEDLRDLGYDVWYYPDWHARSTKISDAAKSTEAAFARKTIGSSGPGVIKTEQRYRRREK
jgi:SAM-dependent methyltransferase